MTCAVRTTHLVLAIILTLGAADAQGRGSFGVGADGVDSLKRGRSARAGYVWMQVLLMKRRCPSPAGKGVADGHSFGRGGMTFVLASSELGR